MIITNQYYSLYSRIITKGKSHLISPYGMISLTVLFYSTELYLIVL